MTQAPWKTLRWMSSCATCWQPKGRFHFSGPWRMAPRGSPSPWRRAGIARVAEALQRLVWQGEATGDGLGFPRAGGLAAAASASAASGQTPSPSRRRASSRRGRSLRSEARMAARAAVVGRQVAGDRLRRRPRRALARPLRRAARVPRCKRCLWWNLLLDRDGVCDARHRAGRQARPAGLRRCTRCSRPWRTRAIWRAACSWKDMGPAQFAQRETVETLRAFAQPADASAPVPPSSRFPPTTPRASSGGGVSLARRGVGCGGRRPCGRFRRRGRAAASAGEGAMVGVIADGVPVLWADAAL